MKKVFLFNLLLVNLLTITLLNSCGSGHSESPTTYVSCGSGHSESPTTYVEKIPVFDETIAGIVESYTSGLISGTEPLKFRFVQGLKMKRQFGEELPSKLFEITPKVAGHAVWIDKNTVGFQFDESPKPGTPHEVAFNIGMLVEMPVNEKVMKTSFLVRRQDFEIGTAEYSSGDAKKCSYTVNIKFARPINSESALSLLDKNTLENFECTARQVTPTDVQVVISNIKRKNDGYDINVAFDGKSLEINRSARKTLTIPAKGRFDVVHHNINVRENIVSVYFSEEIDRNQNLAGYVMLSNNMSFTTSVDGNCLKIFLAKTSYRYSNFSVTLRQGIMSDKGVRTANDFIINDISLKSIKPEIRWSDDGVIVPEVKGATVAFDAICLKEVILRVVKVYDNNVMSYLQDEGLASSYGRMNRVGRLMKKVRVPLEQANYDSWKTYHIALSDFVDIKPGDMYQLNLDFDMTCYPYACDNEKVAKGYNDSYWDNDSYDYRVYYFGDYDYNNPCSQYFYNYVDIHKNLFVSNLAITAKGSGDDFINVFVKNITDASPAGNVKVRLFDYQMQQCGESQADAEGYARVFFNTKPYFVVAENASGDRSYLPLEKNKSLSLSKFDVSGNAVEHDVDGFVYSNRDVWRPGDSIQLNLMISDKNDYFSNDYPVVMEITDPNGRLYLKKANNTPVGKIYAFTFNTLASDPTGTWNAHFKIGNQVFQKRLRVETVKPNRLKINFEPKDLISLNAKDKVLLHSTRLNGLNVKDLKAEVSVILSKSQTTFKGFEKYDFDCIANDFYSNEMSLFSAALNAEGKAMISFDALKDVSAPGFMKAIYNIKVFESSGEFSITSRSGKISPYRRYVGVALPETQSRWGDYYFTDKDWKFDVVVVNEDGTAANDDIELNYQLYKLDSYWWWDNDHYDLMRYVRGSYKRPVKNGTLEARDGKTALTLNIKDADWGSYLLVVSDPVGRHTFSKVISFDWADGARSTSAADAPALITVKTDKDCYNVGETMRVSFPANENSKAIVTVETSSKVIKVIHVQQLDKDATVSIPVSEDMIPNAYVAVSLIQPFRNGGELPIRMYGVAPFKVTDSKSIIKPVIEAPESTTSNKTVEIKISERQGLKMYYTIAVVDEGLLGLTGYKTADPSSHFFSKRALGVRTWDNYDAIVSAMTDMMQGTLAAGGDGFIKPETTLLERFQAVAAMMGPFELEAGHTDIQHFNIPDYNGSLRVMVVATNGRDAFGSSDKDIIVKDKIMIIPTTPRTIGIDDEAVINIKLIAEDFAGKTAKLNVSLENLEAKGNIPQTVAIGTDGEADVAFTVKAKQTKGTARVSVTASCGESEARKSLSMPIRMPSNNKYNMVKQEVGAGETATLHIDCQGFDGTIETKLVANTGIPVNLFKHIDRLTSHPYGCLEQTVSRAFPQLYLNNLVSLDETTKAELKANVENVIANMNTYLLPDFSMTSWPNGKYVDPWSELYALHFLIEARNQGYDVSNSLIDNIIKYQTNRAKAWNYSADAPSVETIQAYRLFVLALNNTPELGSMNRFKELEMKYPLTKALIAASYALVGKTNIASELIPVIDYSASGWTSDYYITLGSKVRDMAMGIYAEMLANDNTEIVQNDIEELCRILGSDRWLDTQTTAMSVFVLGKYAEKLGVRDNSIAMVIKDGDRTENVATNRSSITYNMQPKRGDNAVTVTNNGTEPVFVTLFTKGKVAEYQREDAGAWYDMTVKYLDKNGNEINPEKIAQNTDFDVVIKVANPHEYQVTENALSFHAAAGWELINSRLFGDNTENDRQAKHIEYQDDYVDFIFDLAPFEAKVFRLSLNAAYEGIYTIPSVTCEDMYNNQIWYTTAARKTTVVR
ncbi:MAG: MG2 domain-containing protein [Bacteroidales bacterium]|nr:MG2 domain-containing protein [Bacteroidales bacterium]